MAEGESHNATLGHDVPFAARLRRLRESAGLMQEELAERSGLSARAIRSLERGERKHPYPHTVRSLADALGLSENERASLLAAVPGRGSATQAPATTPLESNLPTPSTPLLGREKELREIKGSLGEVRLLTLTGTGGVGKTRLALQAAQEAAVLFPDGAVLVALAPLIDPALVVPAVAQTLGVQEAEGQTPREALVAHLREKKLLLVLDNFEHVLEAAPEVAVLIASSKDLTVLATSRAPLRVRGEQDYPVGPLALPVSTLSPGPEEILGSPAGSLFVERAKAASPAFTLDERNVAAVAAICWRLAGLPLALELAVAKARFLDPEALLARLDRALSVGWARDLPERQRTMQATLDWSYDLLQEPEQALFRRLSVFAGGFSLEAAEDVGGEETIYLLGELVEQSLVVTEADEAGTCYRLLEPVRQYAGEKLEEGGEAVEAHGRHAAFFLSLAERAAPELHGLRQVEWLGLLDLENDNLRAALSWAISSDEAGTAAGLG